MKTKVFIIFVLSFLVLVIACTKNDLFEEKCESEKPYGIFKYSELNLTGITKVHGMLKFIDMNKFNYIEQGLEDQCDDYWDDILQTYGSLSDSMFNVVCDSLEIDENDPMRDFEEYFDHYSLRKKIEEDELDWLDNTTLDTLNDPDNHWILDEATRTLLNQDGEVIIGQTIFKVFPSGTILQIDHLDTNLLDDINRWDTIVLDTLTATNFSFFHQAGNGGSGECRTFKYKKVWKNNAADNRRIKAKLHISTLPWSGVVKAKTKNYKKKNNGKWKVYRTYASARINTNVYDGTCSFVKHEDSYSALTKRKVIHRIKFPDNPIKTKSEETDSYHYGGEGIVIELTLCCW